MLYDTRWNTATTELDRIISWLETQQPGRHYHPTRNVYTCLFGRYVRSKGIGRGEGLFGRLRRIRAASNSLYDSDLGVIAAGGEYTYGAALARARKLRGW